MILHVPLSGQGGSFIHNGLPMPPHARKRYPAFLRGLLATLLLLDVFLAILC